jgi:hypothetical protein
VAQLGVRRLIVPLRPLAEFSAADWFVGDEASMRVRASLGPSCFPAYARVLHGWGRDETGSDDERSEGHLDEDLLSALVDVLGRHTATPEDCFFGLWEGYGELHGGDAMGFLTRFAGPAKWPGRIFTKEKPPPPIPPAFPPEVMNGPLLEFDQQYFVFTGRLDQAGEWGAASTGHGVPRHVNSPNLMWPADHAWFVMTNIDNTFSGVGGSEELISALLADPRLETVRQRYDVGSL